EFLLLHRLLQKEHTRGILFENWVRVQLPGHKPGISTDVFMPRSSSGTPLRLRPDNILEEGKGYTFYEYKHFVDPKTVINQEDLDKIKAYALAIRGGKKVFSYEGKPLTKVVYIFSNREGFLRNYSTIKEIADDYNLENLNCFYLGIEKGQLTLKNE
ncbi:MAG: hypothetical protein NW226_17060, partial [Microscillaceae bacterium]|nr:hypothetical protein [Microscillaceae bacterium]